LVVISILSSAATVCCRDREGGAVQDIRLEALDGSRFYLGDHRGKTVVMVFWSVHCVPCHRQLVAMSKHSLMNDQSLKIVSVCVDPEDRALVEQGAKMFGERIPILLDHDRTLASRLGIKTEPVTLIVDGKGTEISRLVGYDDTTLSQIAKAVVVIAQRRSTRS
jgi:peroxiredoxin